MKTRRITLAMALIAVATMLSAPFIDGVAFAGDDARETSLKAAEMTRFEAQVNADAKVLGTLLDDALEYMHSNGELDTKKSFIDSLVTGRLDYVSSTATIETVRIFGEAGVIRGKARVTVSSAGKSQDLHIGYTDVWLWKDGRWQMTSWRSARLPDSPVK